MFGKKAPDDGYTADTVYNNNYELPKAFEKVTHKHFLYKTAKYGINNQLLKWIESYLET